MEVKEKIIQDFKELVLHIDDDTADEINNKLADIITRVRSLYSVDRDG